MGQSMTALIFGVLVIVVGLVLESPILATAASAGGARNLGWCSGAQHLTDRVPLVYNAAIVVMGVGVIAEGGGGMAGRGPLGKR